MELKTWNPWLGALSLGAVVAFAAWNLQQQPAASPPLLTAANCSAAPAEGPHPGMVWVPGGRFTMGTGGSYPEEGPPVDAEVAGFWMDQTEVTNAQFAAFVAATGYVTLAERGITDPLDPAAPPRPGSAVFVPPAPDENFNPYMSWWRFVDGANWREPQGPGSSITGLENHPVVHIAWEDAVAYAAWKGNRLPTEAEFEYAAAGQGRSNAAGAFVANTWQGNFPYEHTVEDGYSGTAPVACFTANPFGIHDLIGNVWEWTQSPFFPGHDTGLEARFPEGFDPNQPAEEAVAVIKGGSYLCAPNYCMRYRPEARQGQSKGLSTSHIGFRTVRDA